jgi:hypothetical protein
MQPHSLIFPKKRQKLARLKARIHRQNQFYLYQIGRPRVKKNIWNYRMLRILSKTPQNPKLNTKKTGPMLIISIGPELLQKSLCHSRATGNPLSFALIADYLRIQALFKPVISKDGKVLEVDYSLARRLATDQFSDRFHHYDARAIARKVSNLRRC